MALNEQKQLEREQKQLERQRERQIRERKFRRRLTTLSWTVPIFAFGTFFSTWHAISGAVSAPTKSAHSHLQTTTNHTTPTSHAEVTKSVTPTVLFQIGSDGPQVTAIQAQLTDLGYFNHVLTEYYGPVTSQAVQAFQSAHQLSPTGEIDSTTLKALQQAVKQQQASGLGGSSAAGSSSASSSSTGIGQSSSSASGSQSSSSSGGGQVQTPPASPPPAVSQQQIPQTSSSAS